MAPLERGPFYAVKVVAGSLGTFAGLRVNAQAQVLDVQGQLIAGLYAGGNDMASMMGGNYPSGGITRPDFRHDLQVYCCAPCSGVLNTKPFSRLIYSSKRPQTLWNMH